MKIALTAYALVFILVPVLLLIRPGTTGPDKPMPSGSAATASITEGAGITEASVSTATDGSTAAGGLASEPAATDPVTSDPVSNDNSLPDSGSTAGSNGETGVIFCKYFNHKDFLSSVSKATSRKAGKVSDTKNNGKLLGGIVPHHLLASDMIACFFKTLAEFEPDTIVILAPNHARVGKAVNTGLWSWQTAFGSVEVDKDLANFLLESRIARTDMELLEEDHSVSALVPYIKFYMPQAKIVPILLHGNYGIENSVSLGRELAKQLTGKNSLVIASVDFSHYLTPEKAEEMDSITLEAIKAFDVEAISRMGNDNLDSPPSLMTLLSYLQNTTNTIDSSENPKNSGNLDNTAPPYPVVLEHSNSAHINGKWSSSTTSYFTITFYSP